ncbi:39S ribosomal protein L2, mitochondrial [Nymphon striatum]|nr:39S ribosomal protein L2, mitochondrial [Nymphon striatum]
MALAISKLKLNVSLMKTLSIAPAILESRNIYNYVVVPKPGNGKQYRRKVIFPEDGKYTTEPLDVIRMGGRDPVSGRAVTSRIGGGMKYKYTWVDHKRAALPDGKPMQEKIVKIEENKMVRTAKTALVASGTHKRWIIATENMKVGDIITTYSDLPKIPIMPKEGNSHPVGALPVGTEICNVAHTPSTHGFFAHAAGTKAVILRKVKDRVIIKIPSKQEISVDQNTMATVGRVSNKDHNTIHIGSASWNRWLGNRPKSGLWHRKTGYHGRKIRRLPPVRVMNDEVRAKDLYCDLTS